MTGPIDAPCAPGPWPIARPAPVIPTCAPVLSVELGKHRLHEFIPGGVPYWAYLKRQNVIDRYTEPRRALWPATRAGEGTDSAQRARSERDVEPGRGTWPRLGDVTRAETLIERRVRVVYRVEQMLPAGTRIDLVG